MVHTLKNTQFQRKQFITLGVTYSSTGVAGHFYTECRRIRLITQRGAA